jgi:hypothetical protein
MRKTFRQSSKRYFLHFFAGPLNLKEVLEVEVVEEQIR